MNWKHISKHMTTMYSLCGGAMFLFATSGILSAQAGQTYEHLAAAHPDWVQVPGQLIRPDCVHEIPNGAKVEISKDGKVTGDVSLNGQVVAHYDACPEAAIPTRHSASPAKTSGHNPSWNGWVEASQENLSWLGGSDNIDWESGEFYVPNNPSMNGGLIYIFNGIEPASQNWILQPVLQYGYSPAGGGYYWGIASWLVGTGGAWHSPLVKVNAGDKLWGFTEQTGQSGGTSYWETEAYDLTTGAYSWITASSWGLHWTWAYEGVLEVYGVNYCSQLPSSGYAYFFYNYVDHGYPSYYGVSPGFWPAVYQSGCGDSVYVNDTYDYAVLYY
jgi:hypothetical protein